MNSEDLEFAKVAVQLGYVSEKQVHDCLRLQKEAKTKGMNVSLSKWLTGKTYLNDSQAKSITHKISTNKIQLEQSSLLQRGTLFLHYSIDKELGRGGMGVVYKAYDTKLNRTVALKILLVNERVEKKIVERFLQEAQSLASLEHPNIVRIFEIGTQSRNYFTMEYIEGQDLAGLINEQNLPFQQIAQIFSKVALALQVVHNKKIIHRDIKPANIMINKLGEPKLMDFGLAKVDNNNLSQTSELLGTPIYMSPEQAQNAKVDLRSDIYSLGASLYEVLTGNKIFYGKTLVNVLNQIVNKDPARPRILNEEIPPDLEAICLKCLEKEPQQRYNTSKQLAKDLENFIEDRSIIARPPSQTRAVLKWVKRNKTLAISSCIMVFTIMITTTYFLIHLTSARNKAEELRKKAESEKQKAEQAWQNEKVSQEKERLARIEAEKARTRVEKARAQEQQARTKAEQINNMLMLKLADEYSEKNDIRAVNKFYHDLPKQIAKNLEWRWIYSKSHQEQKTLVAKQYLTSGTLNKTGRLFATTSGSGQICIWDLQKNKILHQLKHTLDSYQIDFHPNDRQVAFTDGNGQVILWNFITNQSYVLHRSQRNFYTCSFSPDGSKLLVAGHNGIVKLFSTKSRKLLKKTYIMPGLLSDSTEKKIYTVDFHPNGKIAALACGDAMVRLWETKTGKIIASFAGHKAKINHCVFSSDGKTILSASDDRTLKLWESKTGRLIKTFAGYNTKLGYLNVFIQGHTNIITSCAFSMDSKKIISTSHDRTLKLWDIESGKILTTWKGHPGAIRSSAIHPNGSTIVSVGHDHTIKLWNINTRNPLTLKKHTNEVFCCDFHPRKNLLASGSADLTVRLWDLNSGRQIKQLVGHINAIKTCAFNHLGNKIASGSRDRTLRIWKIKTGVQEVLQHPFYVNTCAFSPDDGYILTGGYHLRLWNLKTKKVKWIFKRKGTLQQIFHCTFDRRGKRVAFITEMGICNILDAKTGKLLVSFSRSHVSHWCAFHPDGKSIFITFGENIVWLDIKTKKTIGVFAGHKGLVNSFLITPATEIGKPRLISAGKDDYSIKIWDIVSQKHLLDLQGHTGNISMLAISGSSDKIASASDDGTVKVWSIYNKRFKK